MTTRTIKNLMMLVAFFVAFCGAAVAATPPDLVNYQGVLRDNTDAPEGGSFEMIFHFYEDGQGGSEILFDEHCAVAGPAVCVGETGAVTVTGGLFNVQLGSGNVVDGAGAGV